MKPGRLWARLRSMVVPADARRTSNSLIILAALLASCASQQQAQEPARPPAEDVQKAAQSSPKPPLGDPSPRNETRVQPTSAAHDLTPTTQTQTSQAQTSPKATADDSDDEQEPAQAQSSVAAGEVRPGETASYARPYDPLSRINEKILAVNVFFDDHVGRPVSTGWGRLVPYQARLHIRSFFRNTGEPKNVVNCALQRRYHDAAVSLERFSLNSTLGLVGFFDVAQNWWGLERKPTDFGLTAAHHSVDYGPYLMAPAGGPTSVRDAAGGAVDGHLNPISVMVYVLPSLVYLPISASLGLINAVNERSMHLESFEDVDRYTVDLYGAVQDGYYQKRSHDQAAPGSGD